MLSLGLHHNHDHPHRLSILPRLAWKDCSTGSVDGSAKMVEHFDWKKN